MKKTLSVSETLKTLRSHPFLLQSNIPMGYVPGIPMFTIRNGHPCLLVPYLKYKVTGEVDKTHVYPIRHLVTVSVPSGTIVSIEDLRFNPVFEGADFSQPIGFFRHQEVAHMNREEYMKSKQELYSLYDAALECLVNGCPLSPATEQLISKLAGMLLEPALKPAYKVLCAEFCNRYIQA